jgi:hypothetical protein
VTAPTLAAVPEPADVYPLLVAVESLLEQLPAGERELELEQLADAVPR